MPKGILFALGDYNVVTASSNTRIYFLVSVLP